MYFTLNHLLNLLAHLYSALINIPFGDSNKTKSRPAHFELCALPAGTVFCNTYMKVAAIKYVAEVTVWPFLHPTSLLLTGFYVLKLRTDVREDTCFVWCSIASRPQQQNCQPIVHVYEHLWTVVQQKASSLHCLTKSSSQVNLRELRSIQMMQDSADSRGHVYEKLINLVVTKRLVGLVEIEICCRLRALGSQPFEHFLEHSNQDDLSLEVSCTPARCTPSPVSPDQHLFTDWLSRVTSLCPRHTGLDGRQEGKDGLATRILERKSQQHGFGGLERGCDATRYHMY